MRALLRSFAIPVMNFRFALLVSVALCTIASPGCERPDPAAELSRRGEEALVAKKWVEAVSHFEEALRLNRRSVKALAGLASAHEASGDLLAAALDLERALDVNADDTELRLRLIELRLELNEPEEAAAQLQVVGDKIPEAERLLLQGRIQDMQGDLAASISTLRKVTETEPGSDAGWYYYGMSLARANDHAGARDAFSKAIRSDVFQARAYWRRSLAYQQLGQRELAEQDRRKAAQLDPRLTFADSALGAQVLESLSGSNQALSPAQQ
jgi:tetratricopeptide (TPR) repeat protein